MMTFYEAAWRSFERRKVEPRRLLVLPCNSVGHFLVPLAFALNER